MSKASFEKRWNALRKARKIVTDQLDQIEAGRFEPGGLNTDQVALVAQLDAEDCRLLDLINNLEDERLAKPTWSRHDVVVKLKILVRRSSVDVDVFDQLKTIMGQINEWRRAEPVIMSCAGCRVGPWRCL